MHKRKLKALKLVAIGLMVAGIFGRTAAQPLAGRGSAEPNHGATHTNRMDSMTNQQYCDKLSAINDTLRVYFRGLLKRVDSASKSKPMTWNIIKEYRQSVQFYCRANIAYLSKLPDVGESKDLAQSLTAVLQEQNHVCDIVKEFEGFDANTGNEALYAAFSKLLAGEKALVNNYLDFGTEKEVYKSKYDLQ